MTIRVRDTKETTKRVRIGVASAVDSEHSSWVDDPKLLMPTIRRLEREHAPRISKNRNYQRLYYQNPVISGNSTVRSDSDLAPRLFDVLRTNGANLTAEIIDAAIALICRRLQPKVEPVGGDNAMFQACKRIGRVIDGVAEAGEWLSVFTEIARLGMIGDAGFGLIDADEATGEIVAWELDPNYVFWPLDATRIPRTMTVVIPVPKPKLIARFPKFADQIRKLPVWRPKRVTGVDDSGVSKSDVDTVALGIGWALALGPKHPGRKVVQAGDLVLDVQDYLLDVHQVLKFSWKRSLTGAAGVPLTRTTGPYDLCNKRLLSRTLSALDGAVPWLLTEEESDVEAVSDIDYQRITFPRGSAPPTVVVPNPVSTQSLDRMEANKTSAFRESHINEGAAQGQAPAGFKSAIAQFAWADSVQTILLPQQEAWQRLWRDAARVVVALMGTNQKARVRQGDILAEVTLPDLSRDKYRISFGLVSGLSLTVSGRLEQLSQIQAALPHKLDNEDVLRHIGLPDTQQLADRLLAPRELAEYIVEKALNDGETIAPPRMMGADGLAALFRIANQEYCGALKKPRNYYKRDNLEALRRVIVITDFLMKSPVAPPAPPMPMLPPVPIANDNGMGGQQQGAQGLAPMSAPQVAA